jgi:hypothetical protein
MAGLEINRMTDEKILQILTGKQNGKSESQTAKQNTGLKTYWRRDCYTASTEDVYTIYGKFTTSKTVSASELLSAINFRQEDLREDDTNIFIDGVICAKKAIPEVDLSECAEIKAENNVVKFENGSYYKFTDASGITRALTCRVNLGQPYSELLSGRQTDISWKYSQFWNLLGWDGTYISLYYSQEEQERILKDAGVTEGFFTVEVGNKKREYYFSKESSHNPPMVELREHYDSTYQTFSVSWFWEDYQVGDVFVIDGKEYTLKEDKTLDVPYGVNIRDISYPQKQTSVVKENVV